VDAADEGDTVLVGRGVYSLSATVTIDKGVTCKSAYGSTETRVQGNHTFRCFTVGHPRAILGGFQIRDGGGPEYGGVYCASGEVADCVIESCEVGFSGSGVGLEDGLVRGCTIRDNWTVNGSGGGAVLAGGVMRDCVVSNNRNGFFLGPGGRAARDGAIAPDYTPGVSCVGGGICVWSGRVERCTIGGNETAVGGGLFMAGGTAVNCTVDGNEASEEGGGIYVHIGTVENCIVTGNRAGSGGGVTGGFPTGLIGLARVSSSLIRGNTAHSGRGGGAWRCVLANCTVYGNTAHLHGGGAFDCVIVSSIVYGNHVLWGIGPNHSYEAAPPVILASCTLPSSGEGSIDGPPRFMNAAGGDFRLQPSSPCIDSGLLENPADGEGLDLAGEPRVFHKVDIGAYEFTIRTHTGAWLQGAYDAGAGSMRSDLAGNWLPARSPYAAAVETVAQVLTNATDWVLLQLLTTDNSQVVAAESAFLCADGRIVGSDGKDGARLECVPGHRYHVVVKHRNHLAAMTAEPMAFSNSTVTVDFTTGPDKVMGGTNACVELAPGVWGMIAGDCDGDGKVTAVDRAIVSNQVGKTGYLVGDSNLDGEVTEED